MNQKKVIDGSAVVYCENAFNTTNGKTAHGLVRFTERYEVRAVIDSRYAGRDAGRVLDGRENGIPIVASLAEAEGFFSEKETRYFVVGLAPDGGRLNPEGFSAVRGALGQGFHVDCGLHDFLSEREDLRSLAAQHGVTLRDIRKPPHRSELHFFSGDIEKVDATKIAILGTDSAIGKRTTAWILVHALRQLGWNVELVGTGQTAWLQGARYSMIMDSLVNDFVSGEIEHAVVSAWLEAKPDFIVIEGQGSLMNPAYPGGFEILAAGRPDFIVMQHAPARFEYDGFPGYKLHPLAQQIHVAEVLSGKPVAAVTINHEDLDVDRIDGVAHSITMLTGLPAWDPLVHGGKGLAELSVLFREKGDL